MGVLAAQANISLTIDAEEVDRLADGHAHWRSV
jgi:hypothetical protein